MSVAALPPPPHQHRLPMSQTKPRPVMLPRPSGSSSSSVPNVASRPSTSAPIIRARPSAPPPPIRRPSQTSASTPASSSSTSASTPGVNSKDTSSSSGKVFAKPSKEWVLPERAKPGRKVSVEEPDNKRQSQNRLSQRAHRARRTDYIQTLEDRLRQYEADEIHSNVRLQEVARALKADNERLKKDLAQLQTSFSDLDASKHSWDAERRRYEDMVDGLSAELKSLRGDDGDISVPSQHIRQETSSAGSTPPSMPSLLPSLSERRPTVDCPICPDPDPDCPCQQNHQSQPTAPLAALHLAVKAMAEHDPAQTPGGASCGLCQSTDECLCRTVDTDDEEDIKPLIYPSPSPDLLDIPGGQGDGCGLCTSANFCACKATSNGSGSGSSASPSIGFSLFSTTNPVYPTPTKSTAPMPLRLRRDKLTTGKSLWAIDQPKSSPPKRTEAVCSGDPDNCEVCKNDTFGQEFCASIFDRSEHIEHDLTPRDENDMRIQSLMHNTPASGQMLSTIHESAIEGLDETMTPDQAWKALKAHPNHRFASLSMLADVVAGRAPCAGDHASPAPPSLPSSPQPASPAPTAAPHTHHLHPSALSRELRATEMGRSLSASSMTSTSRKRNLAVESSAVRHALHLLDQTPAPPSASSSPAPDAGDRDAKKRRIE